MNTPTPETDKRIGVISNGSNVVDASWARQLERERDQARATNLELATDANSITLAESLHKMEAERDQLRKVCDELAAAGKKWNGLVGCILSGGGTQSLMRALWDDLVLSQQEGHPSLDSYNSLPHVIAAKKGNS